MPPPPPPSRGGTGDDDPVEVALADALTKAAAAGRYDVVARLAGELEARRTARSNVTPITAAKKKRGA
jgi:hypothetical protein